ncbi:hypothetical protein AB0B45_11270 [Nonomuraea sp. NPDC049152]|uniref:hypothetical protein n=1 Tax=Nonomuraea sp. NPDC049152 TaxID=3154350 RepID=UPI0033C3A087
MRLTGGADQAHDHAGPRQCDRGDRRAADIDGGAGCRSADGGAAIAVRLAIPAFLQDAAHPLVKPFIKRSRTIN